MSSQKQHVDYFRKILLRRKLLTYALSGAVYAPFIGDGDIAFDLYRKHKIYGADIDPDRVATAKSRLPKSTIVMGDCNGWPMGAIKGKFSVADFDSYSDPYPSFKAWWANAAKSNLLILFFTDGHRQGIKRSGVFHKPDGSTKNNMMIIQKRLAYNAYYPKFIKPWFVDFIAPYRLVKDMFYLRRDMLYWGAVIER